MKIHHNYDYRSTYQQSLQVNWQVDDIIGGEKTLDFQKSFLPEVWVDANALDFLSEKEKLIVNHIRSHSYRKTRTSAIDKSSSARTARPS